MVCPTLISVSLTPGPYCFWASAGCADKAAIAAPNSASFLTNIGFLPGFCCGGSLSARLYVGKEVARPAAANRRRALRCGQFARGFAGVRCLCGLLWIG